MKYSAYSNSLAMTALFVGVAAQAGPFSDRSDLIADIQANSLAIAPDGRYAVATDAEANTATLYARDIGSGDLVPLHTIDDGFAYVAESMHARDAVWHPSDFVYVSSYDDDAIHLYRVDRGTETVAHTGTILEGDTEIDSMNGLSSLCLSPDGAYLFAGAMLGGAVTMFAVDPAEGTLTFVYSVYNGVRGAMGMNGINDVVVSPDGLFIYAASRTESAIAILQVRADINALAYRETIFDSPTNIGLDYVSHLSMLPDGSGIIASGGGVSAVAHYTREPEYGRLTFVDATYPGGTEHNIGSGTTAVTEDGAWLLAGDRGGVEVGMSTRELDGSYLRSTTSPFMESEAGVSALIASSDGRSLYGLLRGGEMRLLSRTHGGQVQGAIRDASTNFAVPGAVVEIVGPVSLTAFTGAGGVYRFDTVPPGEYVLSVQAPGYAPDTRSVVIDGYDALTIPDVLMNAEPLSLSGLVSADGSVVPGAKVVLRDGEGAVLCETTTDALGGFAFADAAASGAVEAVTSAAGYSEHSILIGDAKTAISIALDPMAEGDGVIYGRVRGMRMGALTSEIDSHVVIAGPICMTVQPTANGDFVTPMLPAGTYVVHASGPLHYADRGICTVDGAFDSKIDFDLSVAPTPTDVDANGAVNAADIQHVINGLLLGDGAYPIDINGDSQVNAIDVQWIINKVLGT